MSEKVARRISDEIQAVEDQEEVSSRTQIIDVRLPSTRVVTNEPGKNFTEFTLVFTVGELEHRITKRYSFYRAVYEKMNAQFPDMLPEFPPKKWFADMTAPPNVEERRQLLLRYYQALIKLPTVLCARSFLDGHEMPESVSTAFVQALASMS
mmetsp:Transcript_14515/g.43597  ORF Transcript_14515/g.43597 Transcript_14515/m.43597 type:complete len:152 (-) Transcript_14515:33-488(-)